MIRMYFNTTVFAWLGLLMALQGIIIFCKQQGIIFDVIDMYLLGKDTCVYLEILRLIKVLSDLRIAQFLWLQGIFICGLLCSPRYHFVYRMYWQCDNMFQVRQQSLFVMCACFVVQQLLEGQERLWSLDGQMKFVLTVCCWVSVVSAFMQAQFM